MKALTKKLIALGASSVVAVTAGYLVAPWEGKRNHSYLDIVGIPTVCYGETKGVKLGQYYDDDHCDTTLATELSVYYDQMKRNVKTPLPENMEVAYTSLVYNIGPTAWNNSTILKKINAGDLQGACKGILAWNKASFKASAVPAQTAKGETCTLKLNGDYACTVKGLTNRRVEEYKTCAGENADVNEALKELALSGEEVVTVD